MDEITQITNGPDKWTLISSFANRQSVVFGSEAQHFEGIVSSIEHADGSKNLFNIKLQTGCMADRKIHYNTRTKKGTILSLK